MNNEKLNQLKQELEWLQDELGEKQIRKSQLEQEIKHLEEEKKMLLKYGSKYLKVIITLS